MESSQKTSFPQLILVIVIAFVAIIVVMTYLEKDAENGSKPLSHKMTTYDSCQALTEAFETSYEEEYDYGFLPLGLGSSQKMTESVDTSAAPEYSETNVQVQGVDEADIVKTDGQYIYTISSEKLTIAQAYPASQAQVLSQIEYDESTPQEMFIREDTMLVFSSAYYDVDETASGDEAEEEMMLDRVAYYGEYFTVIEIWDVQDRSNPQKQRSIDIQGDYLTSRQINGEVYFVINTSPNVYTYDADDPEQILPLWREDSKKEFNSVCQCADVNYFEAITPQQFITIANVSMDDVTRSVHKKVIAGYGENVYASLQNLYVAETMYSYASDSWWEDAEEETIVHKFSLDEQNIDYKDTVAVPGTVLNQFSMDEYQDHFRIATTKGHVARFADDATSSNNVYVYNKDLRLTGSLEDLAPGEEIYSVRFMGERGYLVTFKKVDPLFAIDLSDPTNPSVLGKLKIPGYSDYLHPYDENHLIGVGKETVEAEEGDFAWYQGVKMAIFDVTDVTQPKELHKVIIGDRGTDSYALNDHKAFLFDRGKDLLVIPVLLAELPEGAYSDSTSGDYTFQGAYVYDITLENGFQLKGTVTHYDSDEVFKKSGYYYYDDEYSIKRSLYIDDILYTVSGERIKLNDLTDLREVTSLEL